MNVAKFIFHPIIANALGSQSLNAIRFWNAL
jgi:hypothetical protein